MGRLPILLTFSVLLGISPAAASETWEPARLDSLLERIDLHRGLAGDHACDLEITATERGEVTGSNRYRLRIRPAAGRREVLLRALSPESEKGSLVLSRGGDMWILTRRTTRPVPVSAQQRLLGDASVGDVLDVDLRGRYRGTVATDGPSLRLDLEATAPDALYEKVRLRIDRASARPQEAEFLSRSGRLLKTLRYRSFLRTRGREVAGEMEIVDGVNLGRVTRIRFSRFAPGAFPVGTFDKENLRALQSEE